MKIEISNDNNWLVLDKEDYQIKLSIEKDSCFLKDFEAIFYRGLTTGFNDAFVIDEDTKDLLISEDPNCLKIIKPVIRGKNINKFSITQNNEYLINTHNGLKEKRIERIKVESYPSILKHLQKYDLILQKGLTKEIHITI